jgi:hypothetical protein
MLSNSIEALLRVLSSVLFVPVGVCLVICVAWILYSAGRVARQAVERARGVHALRDGVVADIGAAAAATDQATRDIHVETIMQAAERAARRSLDATRWAVRAGPSLGLMATLIPMATALSGLAAGDFPSLASNMVVAFSATVVGIAVGLVAYILTLIREGWMRADLAAIGFAAERAVRR